MRSFGVRFSFVLNINSNYSLHIKIQLGMLMRSEYCFIMFAVKSDIKCMSCDILNKNPEQKIFLNHTCIYAITKPGKSHIGKVQARLI